MTRRRRNSPPLDRTRINDLALSYVARFATSSGRLEAYLQRKMRERGVVDGEEIDVPAIVARMVELRYIDDEAYARARSGGLLRKGYGARRVEEALRAAGIEEGVRDEIAPGERAKRLAAFTLARKRGFGPFGREAPDPSRREKQIAAMIRAGHGFEAARTLIDAPDEEAAEDWLAEAEEWEE